MTPGQYGSLASDLRAQGFNPSPKFSGRFEKNIHGFTLTIDFLAEDGYQPRGTRMVDDVPASVMPGVVRALQTARRMPIEGYDLFGAHQKVIARVAAPAIALARTPLILALSNSFSLESILREIIHAHNRNPMIKALLCTLLFTVLSCVAYSQAPVAGASQAYPHVVLNNTEMHPLHSKVTGRDYRLYIAYPDSYSSHPERKYPVVYVTDGYWSFVKMGSLGSALWYDQIVPEYILVGLGYEGEHVDYGLERMYELSPTKQAYGWSKNIKVQGGSRMFLDAIKTEIIPYVESNTRADLSFRVMVGSSMGGLFSLFCMYEEPGLFQGIVAGSPVVDWDRRWLFSRECELRQAALGDDYKGVYHLPCRLFIGVGTAEAPDFVGSIEAFDAIIRTGQYADFAYKFRLIEGERHAGNTAELYNRGLRFVFEPQMPSKVPPN